VLLAGTGVFLLSQPLWAFSKPKPSEVDALPQVAAVPKDPAVPQAKASLVPERLGPGMATLSAALRERLTGQALDEPARRAAVGKLAEEYVQFKHLRKGFPRRKEMIDACQKELDAEPSDTDAAANPFCAIIASADEVHPREARVPHEHFNHATLRKIQQALVAGRIADLNGYPESALYVAMKKLPSSRSIQASMDAALAAPECPSSSVLTALGMRAERDFPEPAAKQTALRLLSRAVNCGEDLSSIKAGYRLGLLNIWDQNWPEANRVLKAVSEDPLAVDFRQRAIYWRYYAATQMKDEQLREDMQNRLLREYPLSLHALLVGGGPSKVELRILNSTDPAVAFRSATVPAANGVLIAAELLEERGEPQAANDLLGGYTEELKEVEAPVQLYATVLLMRSGEVLRKFKWMASLFHDNPSLISPPTLEMLYPLRRFEMIRSYENVVDPYLVISLIRQESAFNEGARSGAGALGLMQLMPATARRLDHQISRQKLLDPTTNVRLGVKLFSHLLTSYDGDVELALAAYNAGKDRVDEWRKRYPTDNRLLFIDLMPFRETREYVASIARNYYWYLRLYDMQAFRSRLLTPSAFTTGAVIPASLSSTTLVPLGVSLGVPASIVAAPAATLVPPGATGGSGPLAPPRGFSVFSQFHRSEKPPGDS
jgi:soluble lytic murein transglycosylase